MQRAMKASVFSVMVSVTKAEVASEVSKNASQSAFLDDSMFTAFQEASCVVGSFLVVVALAKIFGLLDPKTPVKKSKKAKIAPAEHPVKPAATRKVETPAKEEPTGDQLSIVANTLVAAVSAGNASRLPKLLDNARARLLASNIALSPEEISAQLLISALRACAAKRYFNEALAAFDHVEKQIGNFASGATWSVLLWSAVEANNYSRCVEFLERLGSCGDMSQNDFVNMVRFCVQTRSVEKFRTFLQKWRAAGFHLELLTRNKALSVITTNHAMDFAAELISTATNVPLDAVAYNTLMRGFATSGKPQMCLHLYDQMRASGVSPSDVTFGILLDAFMGAGQLDNAERIFDDLKRSDQEVNVVHYTTHIKGLVGAGRLEDARALLHEMHNSKKTRPDVITYSTLAKAYAEAGNVEDGLLLLEMMSKHGLKADTILFNIILSSCTVNSLEAWKILDVFNRVVSYGLEPGTATFSVLIKACAKSQSWNLALEIVASAPTRFGIWPETRIYTQLGQACSAAGYGQGVAQTYATMSQAFRARGQQVDEGTIQRFVRFCSVCNMPAGMLVS